MQGAKQQKFSASSQKKDNVYVKENLMNICKNMLTAEKHTHTFGN